MSALVWKAHCGDGDWQEVVSAHEYQQLSEQHQECVFTRDRQDRELAPLRADKERLDWLERFLQLGGSSVFTSCTGEAHKSRPDDTPETEWNHPFLIGHEVELNRGCYRWNELSNGSRTIRAAIDAARAALEGGAK